MPEANNYGKFAQSNKANTVQLTAATGVLSPTAPTNVVQVAQAGANGALLTELKFLPLATTAAGTYYLFSSTDGGTTKEQIKGVAQGVLTVSTTLGNPEVLFEWSRDDPLPLQANEILYAGISFALATGVNAIARWADF
jgi:hypothetical protein